MKKTACCVILMLLMFATPSACVRPAPAVALKPTQTMTPFQPIPPTLPPVGGNEQIAVPSEAKPSSDNMLPIVPAQTALLPASPTPSAALRVWIAPSVPRVLQDQILADSRLLAVETQQAADWSFAVFDQSTTAAQWVYVLGAAFPTVVDGVTGDDLRQFWHGELSGAFEGQRLMVSETTFEAFQAFWGEPSPDRIEVVEPQAMLERAWNDATLLALIPFEEIGPRWKVLKVDGMSPFDWQFEPGDYPLTIDFGWSAGNQAGDFPLEDVQVTATNRDPEKMTSLVMTGVTALVRATAVKMEKMGLTYPANDIREWLLNADLTHISNEVSFEPTCPDPNAYQESLMFCSKPEYVALLDDIDADIIELSGNHLADWRRDSLLYTFDLYQQYDMQFYAAGENLEAARNPLLIEDHGNRLAFIGCNPAGPESVWATADRAGVADCDYEWMQTEVSRLRGEGYLPIVTLQYHETYAMAATPYQKRDFGPFIEAGAVIVSGSQSHFPQAMTFIEDGFIHYGLGNLFFDQMDTPVIGTRREFIDRHIFYDGQYMGTELLTALLEEYAKPRPMTDEERRLLLQEAFDSSDW